MEFSVKGFNCYLCVFVTAWLLLAYGCSVPIGHYDQGVDATGKPNWVTIGTQTSKTARGRIFVGVGSASTQGDFERQSNLANIVAKQEVQSMLERYIEVATRDFLARDVKEAPTFKDQVSYRQIGKMAELIMPNAQILDHWIDQKNKQIYAIAEVDYPQVVSILTRSDVVKPELKKFLTQKGEQVFDRIATSH